MCYARECIHIHRLLHTSKPDQLARYKKTFVRARSRAVSPSAGLPAHSVYVTLCSSIAICTLSRPSKKDCHLLFDQSLNQSIGSTTKRINEYTRKRESYANTACGVTASKVHSPSKSPVSATTVVIAFSCSNVLVILVLLH